MRMSPTQWSPQEAQALLKRLARRDESALAELHRALARRIYAFALNRLHDEGEAEAIVVDTLFEVWNQPLRFRGESQLSTWVLGIARNKVLMSLRGRPPVAQDIDELSEELPDEGLGVFDTVLNRQNRQRIVGCLETLGESQRECLYLTFYEGCGVSEIAQLQSVPEGTVKTRLFHGRKAMKTCLEGVLGGLRLVPRRGAAAAP